MKNPFRQMAIARVPSFHHEHPSYRWWVLGNVLITTFMSVLEATVVNTALPNMQNAFGTSLDLIEWVLTAYNLVFAVVLPLSGWLADKIGYKRTFILSVTLFTLGSFSCSFAWNEDVLILFRIIQGIGGGMIMPVGMAIVTREFPPQQRGMAMGFYGIAAAASVSIGPSLGGYLVDSFGWSSIFLINVPFGIISIVAALLIQREFKKPNMGSFDFWGFFTISVFLISLILALADGNAGWNTGGWTSPLIITCFTISAVSFFAFIVIELNVEHPIIDLRLFLEWNFGLSNILMFFIGLTMMGSTFLMPVYLQNILFYTALQSGLIFLPQGILQAFTSPITGILSDKVGAKIPALFGMVLLIFSFYLNTLLSTNPPDWVLMLPIFLRGISFGLIFISVQAVSINSLPRDKIAQGSSMITLTRQIGSSFGVAIFGSILTQRNTFHQALSGEGVNTYSEAFKATASGLKNALISQGGQTNINANTLAQSMISRQVSTDAFVQSVNDVFLLVMVMIALCIIPIFLLRMPKRKKEGAPGGPKEHAPMME